MPFRQVLPPLAALASAALAGANVPACAAGDFSDNRDCAFRSVAAASLAADGAGADESLGLAQRQTRSLLAPRSEGRRAVPAALPPVAFVKTHKTGGSTMANIMNRLVMGRELSKVHQNDNGVINWRMLEQQESPKHQYDIICNHEMFNETAVRAYLKPSPFIFSILREPMAMTNSRFSWKARKSEEARELFSTWAGRLGAMRENRELFTNPLARDFGWYGGVDIRREEERVGAGDVFRNDNDTEAIAQFIDRIDKALDLAFLTEHYDEGLVLFRRKLGLGMVDVSYLRMKDSHAEQIADPTPEEREAVKEFLRIDLALYDHFSKRFWRQWEEEGGDAVLASEVAELQARNSALERDCAEPRDEEKCPVEFVLDGGAFDAAIRVQEDVAGGLELPTAVAKEIS